MTRYHDSNVPLVICFAIALLLALVCFGLAPHVPARGWSAPAPATGRLDWPWQDRPRLGSPRRTVSNVAWIAHDDFRELLAPPSDTEQPALQREADPVPEAPVRLDAAGTSVAEEDEPTPTERVAPAADEPAASTDETATPSAERPGASALAGVAASEVGDLAVSPLPIEPTPRPGDGVPIGPPASAANPAPAESAEAADAPATAAPRTDRESTAVTRIAESVNVRPGGVVTGRGIEIKTVAPRFSTIARLTAVARNPSAVVTFDRSGTAVKVELTRSSGSDNIDGPILAALYQWTAHGERIERLEGVLEVEFNIILRQYGE